MLVSIVRVCTARSVTPCSTEHGHVSTHTESYLLDAEVEAGHSSSLQPSITPESNPVRSEVQQQQSLITISGASTPSTPPSAAEWSSHQPLTVTVLPSAVSQDTPSSSASTPGATSTSAALAQTSVPSSRSVDPSILPFTIIGSPNIKNASEQVVDSAVPNVLVETKTSATVPGVSQAKQSTVQMSSVSSSTNAPRKILEDQIPTVSSKQEKSVPVQVVSPTMPLLVNATETVQESDATLNISEDPGSSKLNNLSDPFKELREANFTILFVTNVTSTAPYAVLPSRKPTSLHVTHEETSQRPTQSNMPITSSQQTSSTLAATTANSETSVQSLRISQSTSSVPAVPSTDAPTQAAHTEKHTASHIENTAFPVSIVPPTEQATSDAPVLMNVTDLLLGANASGLRTSTSVEISVTYFDEPPALLLNETNATENSPSDHNSANGSSAGNETYISVPERASAGNNYPVPTGGSPTSSSGQQSSSTVASRHYRTTKLPMIKPATATKQSLTLPTRKTTKAASVHTTRKPIGRGSRAPFGNMGSTRRTTKGTRATIRPIEKIFDRARTRPHTKPTTLRPARGMRMRITTKKPTRKGFPIGPKPNVSEAEFDLTSHTRLVKATRAPKTKPTTWKTTFFNVTEPTVFNEIEQPVVRVAGIVKITDGWDWSPLLTDRNTHEYRYLAYTTKRLIEAVFRKTSVGKFLYRVQIDGFSPGSVIVDYFLLLYHQQDQVVNAAYLTQAFNSHLGPNMTLGDFTLDPAYTQLEVVGIQKPNPLRSAAEPPIPQWAIAVIVIATASLIFIILFGAVTIYGRKSERRKYTSRLQEDDLEKMSTPTKDWEGKMAASYENFAADGIYDLDMTKDCVNDSYKESKARNTHKMEDTWRAKYGVLTNKQPRHARDTTF
ncbi:mucin-2-like isoform X2 [Ornithodoros turicata]|uniref:mucin-2-like isoform X2 n=1 Tax=Ornithodoros turicata TaxID=34597 RepID=UPI0031396EFF